jgi:hypothetical protein
MVQIEGNYKLEKNENLEEYFRVVGVPWIARKMMAASTPTMTVTFEDETWVFKTVTFFRTVTVSFKLDEEYKEDMPSGDVIDSVCSKEGDFTFRIKSKHERLGDFERVFDFSDDGLVITMKHAKGVQAKRYFNRIPAG